MVIALAIFKFSLPCSTVWKGGGELNRFSDPKCVFGIQRKEPEWEAIVRKLLPLLLVLLVAATAFAQQNRSRIMGTVATADGAVITGVTVTISSDALIARQMTLTTNERGAYRFVLLPVGTYDIKFEREGYNTIEQAGIVVDFEVTVTLDKVMTPSEFERVVTITGEAPIVDKTDSALGDTLDLDFLQNVPNTRWVWGLAELTGGFTDDSGFGGNIEVGNAHHTDGINLTDPASGGDSIASGALNMEAIEQFDIALIGAPAEYGGFTGSVQNVVTKSGGNDFHGEVNFFARRVGWVSDNTGAYESISAPTASDIDEPNFAVGGPVIRDRIWFFANYSYYKRNQQREIMEAQVVTANRRTHNYFFKVSSMWDDRNITYASLFGHRRDDSHRPDWWWYGWRTHYDGSMFTQSTTGDVFLLHHSWVVSDDLIVEGRLSITRSGFDLDPRNPGISAIDWWTYEQVPITGTTEGTYSRVEYYERPRDNLLLTLQYFNDDLYGTHSFKFGVEYDNSVSERFFDSQDIVYFDGNRETPVAMLDYGVFTSGIRMKRYGLYAQDSWSVNDRLTLNIGIRYDDTSVLSNYPGDAPIGGDEALGFGDWAPRIGFAYDLFGDGRTVLRGHFGRYYEGVVGGNVEELAADIPTTKYYGWGEYWYGVDYGWVLWDEWGGSGNKTVDPGIENQYTEGFLLGFEHELMQNLATGITFIYKRDRNQIGVISPDITWELENISFSNENGSYSGPIYNNVLYGLREIYTNPDSSMVGMLDDLYRKYWAIMFEVHKRMSDNWSLMASYTYSVNTGTQENSWSSAQGFSTFNYPNFFINTDESTRMSIDRPHILKISGTYIAPFDIYVTPVVTYLSGTPWVPWMSWDWEWVNLEVMDGSRRFEGQFNVDLRLEKAFVFADRYRIGILFDVFNLFNDDALTGYRSWNIRASTYMVPGTIADSRFYQLGVRFMF